MGGRGEGDVSGMVFKGDVLSDDLKSEAFSVFFFFFSLEFMLISKVLGIVWGGGGEGDVTGMAFIGDVLCDDLKSDFFP